MIIRPGRPFWSGFTAFAANMVALVGVDKFDLADLGVQITNWWSAAVVSLFVAGAVYGKEKVSELRGTHPPAQGTQP